jgi:hypothetical protein
MHFTCYLRKGMVYIPTLGQMGKGFYRGIEPTAVASVSSTADLKRAILDTIAHGNPVVPVVPGGNYPKPPVLKYAGVKTWTAFAKGTIPMGVDDDNGYYRIVGQKNRPDRGWEDDPDQTITLPAGSTIDDLCDHLIAILQAKAAHA